MKDLIKIAEDMKFVNKNLYKVFNPYVVKNPLRIPDYIKIANNFERCEKLRENYLKRGIMIPPVLILSITSKCNLKCKGCFAYENGNISKNIAENLTLDQWKKIVKEANEIGVFCFFLAGGEPLLLDNLFQLCEEFPRNIFVLFSNGILFDDEIIKEVSKFPNFVSLLSVEGDEQMTDFRRGKGTFKKVIENLKIFEKKKIISGIAVTVTRSNFKFWMNEENIDYFIDNGIKICVLTEYIPEKPDDDTAFAMLLKEEREEFRNKVLKFKETKKMLIIHSPGDEESFGGCVSAGRGFAHITPYGDLTPCPIANIATHNLKNSTLLEALQSDLFEKIRSEENLLEKSEGPCALFEKYKEVEELRKRVGAYRTGNY
jgi:MoaA/NifB/PqqE/SkfB family radical SAM enzyme